MVEEATKGLGLTPLFTGVILVPLIASAAEYVTTVSLALKNNMDLSVSVAMGSSLLVALLVAPILVSDFSFGGNCDRSTDGFKL